MECFCLMWDDIDPVVSVWARMFCEGKVASSVCHFAPCNALFLTPYVHVSD